MPKYRYQQHYKKNITTVNCGALLTRIDFLIANYDKKLSRDENLEVLDILTQIEKNKKHLSKKIRASYHETITRLLTNCNER